MNDATPPRQSQPPAGARRPAPTRVFGRLFPAWIRAFVRARETGLAVVALIIGAVSGLLVAGMSLTSQRLHELLFGLPHGLKLSLSFGLVPWRVIAVVASGGVLLALLAKFVAPRFRGRMHDAIEANALFGGRLSVGGSLFIVLQTIVSNGFGGSVGLEAAYTQIGSVFGSWFGRELGARRNDLRLLVACGAAGAIGGAFQAPFTGAFYAYETILGGYAVASLVPVSASAVVGTLVTGMFVDHRLLAAPPDPGSLGHGVIVHIVMVALICSAVAVALMSAVAGSERLFNAMKPAWLRPVVGGALVGVIGLATTAALGSGHGAIVLSVAPEYAATTLLAIAVLKASAASISLGSGFRGGLFFASLLIGSLIGRGYGEFSSLFPYIPPADSIATALVGMAALGTGIVGAPMAMTALTLEMTDDFGIGLSAFIASMIVTLVVRETFGYSFATWRFHLRGESIRGPHDVGWERDLSVSRLMRKDVRTLPATATIAQARAVAPLGASKDLTLVDEQDRYCGSVVTSDLYSTTEDLEAPVSKLAHAQHSYLTPHSSIRQALDLFSSSEADVLAVVADDKSLKVVGTLSEAHALRRYGEELEKRNRAYVER